MAAVRRLGFLNIRNFIGPFDQKISLRHLANFRGYWSNRYYDMAIYGFQMAAVHHLGILKFEILTVCGVNRVNIHHRTKFRSDRSSRC